MPNHTHRITHLIGLVGLLLLSACASVNSKVYDSNRISAISEWVVEFAYEAGTIEQSQKNSGDGEVKIVRQGQSARDLQLRDDLYYMLKDDYRIPLRKEGSGNSGRIQIHPIQFTFGGFKLLTVTFLDEKGETLARTKIENGDRNGTFKNDDSFTKYAAKAIAEALGKTRDR